MCNMLPVQHEPSENSKSINDSNLLRTVEPTLLYLEAFAIFAAFQHLCVDRMRF